MKIIVTGGAGFIGSAVIRHIIEKTQVDVVNVDKLTYAGDLESTKTVSGSDRYTFEQVDINDAKGIREVFRRHRPDAVMHLAAESHVDRSIDGPAEFIRTNIVGTYTLLEESRSYWQELGQTSKEQFRFHHISTDEVYGSLGEEGLFSEDTCYKPNSPYSASKAASDHIVRAWYHTYGFPVVTSNCSNNYGPYQFPEKLIPLVILKALKHNAIPVYGKGENVRDWLYVTDHAEALYTVLTQGRAGETYNIGGNNEKRNIDVVKTICAILDRVKPSTSGKSYSDLITFVADRPGHDQRYAIDANKIKRELGWTPKESFESGIEKTVLWYLENPGWVEHIQRKRYQGERLGLGG